MHMDSPPPPPQQTTETEDLMDEDEKMATEPRKQLKKPLKTERETTVDELDWDTDYWEYSGDTIIRHHYTPRTTLFDPAEAHDGPAKCSLEMKRTTNATLSNGQTITREEFPLRKPSLSRSLPA